MASMMLIMSITMMIMMSMMGPICDMLAIAPRGDELTLFSMCFRHNKTHTSAQKHFWPCLWLCLDLKVKTQREIRW